MGTDRLWIFGKSARVNEMQIRFLEDGTAKAVYADDLVGVVSELGASRIARASNVEPVEGGWEVRVVDGPSFGPFARRDEAIAFEVDWLQSNGRA